MQTDAMEQTYSKPTAESAILEELRSAPAPLKELKQRVKQRVLGLKDPQFKSALNSLVEARRIHGRSGIGKNGKPKATVESYAFGPPPPPSPPPPPPRELATGQILALLGAGPVLAKDLKAAVRQRAGIGVKDYDSALAALVEERKIHGRRGRTKDGKPTKAVESYALGGQPPGEYITRVLAFWKTTKAEALAAGVEEDALVSGLLDALAREGIVSVARSSVTEPDDRDEVLRSVRSLVAGEGSGALIPMRKLRRAVSLVKGRFDAAVLGLYREDALILHHHDYVGSLSEAEREELVLDQHGNYYVGVALRGGS